MIKGKKKSINFWNVLKVLTLASITTSCLLPVSHLSTNFSSNFCAKNQTILQTNNVRQKNGGRIKSVSAPKIWNPIDLNGATNKNEWIQREGSKTNEQKIKDIFKPSEEFSASYVDSVQIIDPDPHSENIKIKVTLNDPWWFFDASSWHEWDSSLGKWEKVENLDIPRTIDLKNQQTIDQWNQMKLSEKLADLIKSADLKLVNAISELKIIQKDNQAHVSVTLNNGYKFGDPYVTKKEWNISVANEAKLVHEPTFKSAIDLNWKIDIDKWVANENRKSVADKIADLFADGGTLNEENTASITLSINQKSSTNASVLVKAAPKFGDTNNLQTNGLATKNVFVNAKETINGNVAITVKLKEGYIFENGTNSKTKNISLTNSLPASKIATKDVIIGSSIGAVVLAIATLVLIMVWISRKQRKVNKLYFQLGTNQSQKKLETSGSLIDKNTTVRLPIDENAKKPLEKNNLSNSKSMLQRKQSSLRNHRPSASERTKSIS